MASIPKRRLHPDGHRQRRRPCPHCYSVIACERSQRFSKDEPEVPRTSGEGVHRVHRERSPAGFVPRPSRRAGSRRGRSVSAGEIQRVVETCKLKRFENTNVHRNLERDANARTSRAYGIRRDKFSGWYAQKTKSKKCAISKN